MLSAIRRSLHQTSRLTCRGLSTTMPTESLASQSPTVDAVSLSSGTHSGALELAETVSCSGLVNRFNSPVYLAMSSLIRPSDDAPSSAENLVELDPFIFAHPIRRDILHLCVVHYMDSLRQGTASTKTRGEVRGSGHKLRPQKGTGRARLGDKGSPMLRGGGVAFGPKPRDFATKLNRKVIQMGMRVALSARVQENSLGIVESLDWPGTKTKQLAQRIEELGWRRTLFISGLETLPEGLSRSGKNIDTMEMMAVQDVNVYSLVKWPRVVLDLAAVEWFEHTLAKPKVTPRSYDV